jgi:hypothetical protein
MSVTVWTLLLSSHPTTRLASKGLGAARRLMVAWLTPARSYTDTAIKTLAGIMMEPSAPARARIAAAAILLDRGWGKPKENVELPDAEPRQITHIVREIVHLPPGGVQLDMEPADDPEPVLIWRSNGKNGAD